MTTAADTVLASVPALWDELTDKVAAGRRLADLFGTARPDGLLLTAHLAGPGRAGDAAGDPGPGGRAAIRR